MTNITFAAKGGLLANYEQNMATYDELLLPDGTMRPHYANLLQKLSSSSIASYKELNHYASETFFQQGITFNVYNEENKGVERIFPFDLLPRLIVKSEWDVVEKGLLQRAMAINLFLNDIYHDKKILKDKVVPFDLIFSSPNYCHEMINFSPIGGVYTHISGTDVIRHKDGKYYVLEDNVRCPSGVSYVLSNREAMKRTLPHLFHASKVSAVQEYPEELLAMMQSVAPNGVDDPTCVVLTPGVYNSAYYEHAFLAMSMGATLVEGRDLFVDKNYVYMKTIHGNQKVDVIYRRIDDAFLDPLIFRPDSLLGVPGLMGVYREGNVNIINAPGTGVADDKAVYAYLPDIIKYYLGEEPILNNVQTYRCEKNDELKYVLENMESLVIKPVDESGGYGIMIGSQSTKQEREDYAKKILANKRKYIAQPILSLSVLPTFIEQENHFAPRHIDLRTFTLLGKDFSYVLKGGLTRVALKKGSLIVNSSQGGGSKDTWVVKN